MADAIGMYHRDFVRLEVQLRRFGRDGFGDFLQLVAGATHHRAGAGAGRRAVTLAETALIHVGGALKVKVWQILDRHVAHLRRGSATGRRPIQLLLAQPVREPGKMAVAPERIRGKISGKERRNMFKKTRTTGAMCLARVILRVQITEGTYSCVRDVR